MNQYNDKKIFIPNTLNSAHKTIYNMLVLILFSFMRNIKCHENIFNLTCKYPHYFQLNNGYNLLCCSKGIYTYDYEFDQILYNHPFDTEVSETEAEYIVIDQYSDDEGGNVIVLGQNKFYYLDNKGDFIFDADISLTNNAGFHYTLVPYKRNTDYNFIVGIFDSSNQIILNNYKINSIGKEIIKDNEIKPNIKNSYLWNPTFFYGIECKRMKSNKYENILVCFLVDNSKAQIMVYSFFINNEFGIISNLSEIYFFYQPK